MKLNRKNITKIIEEWYSGLSHTQGIVVRLQKVCSDYDILDLIDKIDKSFLKKNEKQKTI